jgi:hypothetical protein
MEPILNKGCVLMTAIELAEFRLGELPSIKDDLDKGQMVVSAVKVRRLVEAFELVEQIHRSDPPTTPPTDAYSPRTEVLQPIAPGSAVYRAAHGTGGGDNG